MRLINSCLYVISLVARDTYLFSFFLNDGLGRQISHLMVGGDRDPVGGESSLHIKI